MSENGNPFPAPPLEDRIVIQAILDRSAPGPRHLYWNMRTGWGRFDEATRYTRLMPEEGKDAVLATTTLPHPSAVLDWMADLPTDLDGYPFEHMGQNMTAWRLTPCCAAMPGIDDGPLYCKSCYEEADLANDAPARLDANWNPGDGPIRITLEP